MKSTTQTVKGNRGDVTIDADADGGVRVAWFCGAQRTFTRGHLYEVVELIDMFAERYPDAWLSLTDSYQQRCAVRVVDGALHGRERAISVVDEDLSNIDNVPWRSMRTHLLRAVRRGEKP